MTSFETLVQNNLHYWLRNVSWSQAINVAQLIAERENIAKAIKKGISQNKTFDLAVHLLCISADVMMQIGGGRQWNLLAGLALNHATVAKNDYIKGRLLICQAKYLFTQERYQEAIQRLDTATPIAKQNKDADLLWQIYYHKGLNNLRLDRLDIVDQCVQEIRELFQKFTLLNPSLCKGYLGLLCAELALQKLDWDQANYCLKIAIQYLTKSGAEHNLSKAYRLLGEYYILQQKPQEALQAWLQALELLPDGFDFVARSSLMVRCAGLQLDVGEVAGAETLIQKVDFSMLRLLEHEQIHLDAVLVYGRLAEAQGNIKQAELIFEDAKILSQEIGRQM